MLVLNIIVHNNKLFLVHTTATGRNVKPTIREIYMQNNLINLYLFII